MQVPFDEIANYPRFHEAARAAFDIAGRLLDGHGLAILAYGERGVTVVKSSRLPAGVLTEGAVIQRDSFLASLLTQAAEQGMALHSGPLALEDVHATSANVVPIVLSSGRTFGGLVTLTLSETATSAGSPDGLQAVATLLAFAIDGELRGRHDRLTGAYTRSMLDDHLALEIARARRNGSWLAVMVLGLEVQDTPFKRSEVWWLARISERLESSVRRGDTVARVGAREFAIVVPDLRNREAAQRMARTLVELLMDPIPAGDSGVQLLPSVGVALVPSDGFDPRQLFDRAANAMEYARLTDGERFAFYGDVRHSTISRFN